LQTAAHGRRHRRNLRWRRLRSSVLLFRRHSCRHGPHRPKERRSAASGPPV
jgi:hypothetical protein